MDKLIVWFRGEPGAGKTTLRDRVRIALSNYGDLVLVTEGSSKEGEFLVYNFSKVAYPLDPNNDITKEGDPYP